MQTISSLAPTRYSENSARHADWDRFLLRLPKHLASSVAVFFSHEILPLLESDQFELLSWMLKARPGIDIPSNMNLVVFTNWIKKAIEKMTVLDLSNKNLNNDCTVRLNQALDGNQTVKIVNLTQNPAITNWSDLTHINGNRNIEFVAERVSNVIQPLNGPKEHYLTPYTFIQKHTAKMPHPQKILPQAALGRAALGVPNWNATYANKIHLGARKIVNDYAWTKHLPKSVEEQTKVLRWFLLVDPKDEDALPKNTDLAAIHKDILSKMKRADLSVKQGERYKFDDSHAELLLAGLEGNTSLIELNLFRQPISPEYQSRLQKRISENQELGEKFKHASRLKRQIATEPLETSNKKPKTTGTYNGASNPAVDKVSDHVVKPFIYPSNEQGEPSF